jgi:hypothetical protein
MSESFAPEPPEPEPHWTMDLPDGATAEDLAASLIRDAEAVCALDAAPVFVRRGDGEWTRVTVADRYRW